MNTSNVVENTFKKQEKMNEMRRTLSSRSSGFRQEQKEMNPLPCGK